ncbi:uncharacterized protein [Salminus brasiliensis]|uniref:uncharacterized protein n=1 Tax=Salminus brasiliensis TaxID=930266 RepID=UPI003B8307FE
MKSSKDINLDTYNLSLVTAKEDVLNPRTSTNWALFAYDGVTNRLKLADSGVGGVPELVHKLHPRRPLYGLCRVDQPKTTQTHIVMIIWVGKEVDDYRRAQCVDHVPAIKSFFKEVHFFVPASSLEDVTEERIFSVASTVMEMIDREKARRARPQEDRKETVGTNYKRTIAAAEIRKTHRENFWAQAEREEEARKEEERRRALEDRRRRERERVQQEKKEAEERERRMNEKLKKIQEQRQIQAQAEAEKHKQEQLKWAQQQKEFEEEMRFRFTHSESVEKAAEAAALVSQRKRNPREFFRQLSLSSSSDTQPKPPSPSQTVSSNRRFHRSLTDAFIFTKSSSSSPSSPCSPKPLSPFFPSSPTAHSPTALSPTTQTQPQYKHSSSMAVSPSVPPCIPTQSLTVGSPPPPSSPSEGLSSPPSGQIVVSPSPSSDPSEVFPSPPSSATVVSPSPTSGPREVSPSPSSDQTEVSTSPPSGQIMMSPLPLSSPSEVISSPYGDPAVVSSSPPSGPEEVFPSPPSDQTAVCPSLPSAETVASPPPPSNQTVVSLLPLSDQTVVEIPKSVSELCSSDHTSTPPAPSTPLSTSPQPCSPDNAEISLTEIVEGLTFYPPPPPQPTADINAQSLDQSDSEILTHPQTHSNSSVAQNPDCDLDLIHNQSTAQVQPGITSAVSFPMILSAQPVPKPPSRPLPALPMREFDSLEAVISIGEEGERQDEQDEEGGEKREGEVTGQREESEEKESEEKGRENVLEAWVTAQASMISIPEEEGDDADKREGEEELRVGKEVTEEDAVIDEKPREESDQVTQTETGECVSPVLEKNEEIAVALQPSGSTNPCAHSLTAQEIGDTVPDTCNTQDTNEEFTPAKDLEPGTNPSVSDHQTDSLPVALAENMVATILEPLATSTEPLFKVFEEKCPGSSSKDSPEFEDSSVDVGIKEEEVKLEKEEKDPEHWVATQASKMSSLKDESVDGEAKDEKEGKAGEILVERKETDDEAEKEEKAVTEEKEDGKEGEGQGEQEQGVEETVDGEKKESWSDQEKLEDERETEAETVKEDGEEDRIVGEEISARREENNSGDEMMDDGKLDQINRASEIEENNKRMDAARDEVEDEVKNVMEVEESFEREDAVLEDAKYEVKNTEPTEEKRRERDTSEDGHMGKDRETGVDVEEAERMEKKAESQSKSEPVESWENNVNAGEWSELEKSAEPERNEESAAREQHMDEVKAVEFTEEDTAKERQPGEETDKVTQTETEECVRPDALEKNKETAEAFMIEVQPSGHTNPYGPSHTAQELDDTVPATFSGASCQEHVMNAQDTNEEFIPAGDSQQCETLSSANNLTIEVKSNPSVSDDQTDSLPEALAENMVATILESLAIAMEPSFIVSEENCPGSPFKTRPEFEDSSVDEACEEAKEKEEVESEGEAAEEESETDEVDCEPAEWHTAELKTRHFSTDSAEQPGPGDASDEHKDTDFTTSTNSNQLTLSPGLDPVQETSDVEDGHKAFTLSAEDKASYEEAQEPDYDSDSVEEATEQAFLPAIDVNLEVMDIVTITDTDNKIKAK